MRNQADSTFDVAVIGGGATGLAAALTSAASGFRTIVFAPPASFPAGRTAALLQGSVDVLTNLGVWPSLLPNAAPLRAIRIVDATQRLIRAPETTFHASEIGVPAFGYNVPNGELVAALARHATTVANLTIAETTVEAVTPGENEVSIQSSASVFRTKLVVAADGARSLAREAAGISTRRWTYRQSALVATLAIRRAHGGISTEFHTEAGPFTLVPLPGDRVSLVWVDRPAEAERAASLDQEAFSQEVERRAHFIHGDMRLDSAPALFPLGAALAERFAARRTMLVGEAAHRFPPIGAQGLNLGFRDVAALGRVLIRYRDDPGAVPALNAYHAARQTDIRTRTLAVDLLNRSLLTDFLPVQGARGLGLALVSSVPMMRRALMRQGLAGVRH